MNWNGSAGTHDGYEPRSITKLFHRLNSVIPNDQEIVKVLPETPVHQALELLREHGFSQLPVVVGDDVLGMFSYRSFAQAVITQCGGTTRGKTTPQDLLVEDCMEKPTYARVTDEFSAWFDALDKKDAVLVGDPNRLQAIVTAMDILRYLYRVASPFVQIAEIELSLRALIRLAVNDGELIVCAKNCLKHYAEGELPTSLEDMTFGDYVQIVGDSRNWECFQPVFLSDRRRVRTKLEQIRELRNDVFHFRRDITVEEY